MNTFSLVRYTLIQTAALCLLVLVALLILGGVMAYSVLFGGLISVIPNAWFARQVFRHSGARSVERMVRGTFIGEAIKLVLMGLGFALVFALVEPLSVPGVFAGFILTHVAGLAGAIRLQHIR